MLDHQTIKHKNVARSLALLDLEKFAQMFLAIAAKSQEFSCCKCAGFGCCIVAF